MTPTTAMVERELRAVFAEDAARVPVPGGLAETARRAVRRRRLWFGGAGVGTLVAAALLVWPGAAPDAPAPEQHGALWDDAAASCVEAYTPTAVAGRAFAFDGTVTGIEPDASDGSGTEIGYAAVTFTVHEWFRGGSGDTVTVDMWPPTEGPEITQVPDGEWGSPYAVGTRLLVSGEPRWGGQPLDQAIAWTCGFTRYYDETTATQWRTAVGGG